MTRIPWLIPLLALAGCGGKEEATPTPAASALALAQATSAPEPNLAACPKADTNADRMRTKPLPVPEVFGTLAKSDIDHLAVVTADGSTVCVDTSWLEAIDSATVSPDNRFFSFGWRGNEAFGHVVVDRSGRGQVIDTGNAPNFAPSGKRLAAVDLSESAFGSLNAFAVWDIAKIGLKEIAHIDAGLPSGDWRIDGWQGDDCVRLGLLPSDRYPEDYDALAKTPHDPWFASAKNGWKPMPGSCPK